MGILAIIGLIVVIIIIFLIIIYFIDSSGKLTGLSDATESTLINSSKLYNNGQNSVFGLSVWIYVEDWSYNFGSQKIIVSQGTNYSIDTAYMSLYLASEKNDVKLKFLNEDSTCDINNVPLQTWCCLAISVNSNQVDMYLNGKLVRTCILNNVIDGPSSESTTLYLTPDGGFEGSTSRLCYWKDGINPQQAWNIYKRGPGGNPLASIFSKYKLELGLYKGGEEIGGIVI